MLFTTGTKCRDFVLIRYRTLPRREWTKLCLYTPARINQSSSYRLHGACSDILARLGGWDSVCISQNFPACHCLHYQTLGCCVRFDHTGGILFWTTFYSTGDPLDNV